jgi:hypothetical protein
MKRQSNGFNISRQPNLLVKGQVAVRWHELSANRLYNFPSPQLFSSPPLLKIPATLERRSRSQRWSNLQDFWVLCMKRNRNSWGSSPNRRNVSRCYFSSNWHGRKKGTKIKKTKKGPSHFVKLTVRNPRILSIWPLYPLKMSKPPSE